MLGSSMCREKIIRKQIIMQEMKGVSHIVFGTKGLFLLSSGIPILLMGCNPCTFFLPLLQFMHKRHSYCSVIMLSLSVGACPSLYLVINIS